MGALLMRIPSSSHPMGLRGRRIASKVPTTATGTVVPTTDSVSASGPPVPAWCVRLSSGTWARLIPSATSPNTKVSTSAARRTAADPKFERTRTSPQLTGQTKAHCRDEALRKRYGPTPIW